MFESRCADVVASQRGRVIKSIGDSVLFVNDDPIRAHDTAEGIIQVIGRDPRMPDVRVGLATGSVVMRLGDVFGPPVNLAARLTAVARRNRVIIDEATAEAAARGPVRDPAAARASGPRLRRRRAGRGPPALTPGRDIGIYLARAQRRSYGCPVFEVQDVRLDPESRRVWRGAGGDRLSRKEFDLVHALISRAGEIVTRDELMLEVWARRSGPPRRRSTSTSAGSGASSATTADAPADHHDPGPGPRGSRPRTTAATGRAPASDGSLSGRALAFPCPTSPPPLAVIGGGQLARMMAQPAIALGLPLRLLAEAEGVSAAQVIPDHLVGDYRDLDALRKVTDGCDVVTFDHEHVPTEHLQALETEGSPAAPGPTRSCTPRTRA